MLTKIELAKSKIALHAGFFISLTSKLSWEEKAGVGTAGTDGRRVFYDPKFMEELTVAQAIGLVLHETGHNMLSHPARIGGRNPQLANIAMDIVLNQMLLEYFEQTPNLKAELPPGGIFGPQFDKYKGWSWERVYGDLEQQCQDGEDGKGKGKGKGKLPKQFDKVEQGTNPDGSKASQEELEALAKEWAMAAQQAATMAKQRGSLPGFLQEFVADIVRPRVDWRAQIKDEFSKFAKDEQSWRRFNRRFIHAEMYMPGLYSEHLGRVAFYVDTSGSMGSEEFKLALGAMNEIFDDVKPAEILFVQCDTRIVSEELLHPDDLPLTVKEFKGRGGTELTPMFKHNLKQEIEPELVVVLTDGYHEVIDKKYEPKCKTVWLVTTKSTQPADDSFGKVIRVEA